MQQPELLVHIEFFYAKDCPYCPSVKKMLLELLESDTGKYVIIEEIDINSQIGKDRLKNYNLKGVPSLAINGTLKFAGVPHPILFLNEVKRQIEKQQQSQKSQSTIPQPPFLRPSEVPKNDESELSFYT